ncbi:MAG TPA: hypothetical protein VJR89_33555 [Polyangiales bacterium]|nr:hypothetical protein [Polyangiales bacterium]
MSLRALAWLIVASACVDPVFEAQLDALGPEAPDVPAGPLHRPGQACLVCHDGAQSGVARYTVAGTVYAYRGEPEPAPGVHVELVDARGERFEAETNCAGNFYVRSDQLEPEYPLWTSLIAGDYRIDMQSRVGRDGSCGSCHGEPVSPSRTEPVYLFSLRGDALPETECP